MAAGPSAQEHERALRRRLGIPDDAAQVLVFAESSHWDPDWIRTSEEYFSFVGANLDRAVEDLIREPRRIYSVECMFFLRMYWERRPALQDKVRALVNEGRLRLTSSGVTTADTLIPRPEAILRDWLLGQEWLRANGLLQEPRLAYFTDSFGCSPALPSLLRAAGYDRTAITRVDGMSCLGADYELPGHFPRPGSTGEQLLKAERTLDFVWRAPDGAEVLAHVNAFSYDQGDLLAHGGLTRDYMVPVAWPNRSDRHVARRIAGYVAQLRPVSRTPYLFCPAGCDFVAPIPALVALLDRYNRNHYPETGVWAVNAGLDDYLALVECHRERLPTLALDPNPYWTGFYTARPALKARCHALVEHLCLAERLALLEGNERAAAALREELAEAWWTAATANHHDFITGTSTDRVADGEQRPWLEQASKVADGVVARLAAQHAGNWPAMNTDEHGSHPDTVGVHLRSSVADAPAHGAQPLQWRREGSRVVVRAAHYTLELDEEAGGAIVRAQSADGTSLLDGPSNDLVSYRDSGGLWRMGHEFAGGGLREAAHAGDCPAALEVTERAGGVEIACTATLDGEPVRRRLWLTGGAPLIHGRVEGRAAPGRTVTARFDTGLSAEVLAMDSPGGAVERPRVKVYDPTFWPVQRFWHARDEASGRGVALLLGLPGAVSLGPGGVLEAVALRNATRERAWGVLPLLAMPATGHEREAYTFDYALLFTAAGDWRENELPRRAREMAGPWEAPDARALRALAESAVAVDRPDVYVIAAKPAWRGEGIVVRLYTLSAYGAPVSLRLPGREVQSACLCDARERDLEPLAVVDGAVRLTMPGAIATVRLSACASAGFSPTQPYGEGREAGA